MGSFSIWHWLIVLLIVALLFGTKKLKNLGSDVGHAIKGFKEAVREGEQASETPPERIEQREGQAARQSSVDGKDRQSS